MIENRSVTSSKEMGVRLTESSPGGRNPERFGASSRKIVELTQILRILGAVVIVSSASVFLIQNWDSGNDIMRYLMLLVHTVLLSLAGLFCGLRIRESKGARTFLGISLAVMPVHFAVLGGLIYSQFALDASSLAGPTFARWVAGSPATALLVTAGALSTLAPLGYLSFLSLARPRAKGLTLAFLAANMPLLLPFRDPSLIAILVMVMSGAMAYAEQAVWRREPSLHTVEGRLLRVLMWVPVLLVVGRSVLLYAPDRIFLGALWSSATLLIFTIGAHMTAHPELRKLIQGLSGLTAVLAWNHFACGLVVGFDLGPGAELPLFCLPFAGTLVLMSLYCEGSGIGYRRMAAFIAIAGVIINLVVHPGISTAFLCLAVAAATLAYGFFVEQISIFLSGLFGVVFGLGYHLKYAISLYSLSSWGSLALLGALIIIIASLLERYRRQVIETVSALRSKLKSWDY